jgi:hypothetical protein
MVSALVMTPEGAQRAARMRWIALTQLKKTNSENCGLPMFETFLQDTRYTFRILSKNPTFSAVAVLTLFSAEGIGDGGRDDWCQTLPSVCLP